MKNIDDHCSFGPHTFYPFDARKNSKVFGWFSHADGVQQAQALIELFHQSPSFFARFAQGLEQLKIELQYACHLGLSEGCSQDPTLCDLVVMLMPHLSLYGREQLFSRCVEQQQDFVLRDDLVMMMEDQTTLNELAKGLLVAGHTSYFLKYWHHCKSLDLGNYLENTFSSASVIKEFAYEVLEGGLAHILPVPREDDVVHTLKRMFFQPNPLDPLEFLPVLEKRLGKSIPWERCYRTLAESCVQGSHLDLLRFVLEKSYPFFQHSSLQQRGMLLSSLTALGRVSHKSSDLAKKAQGVFEYCLNQTTPKDAVLACFDQPKMMETLLTNNAFEEYLPEMLNFLGEAYFVRHENELPQSKNFFQRKTIKDALESYPKPSPKKMM